MKRPNKLGSLLLFCGLWIVFFLFYWWFICKSQKEHFAAAALIGLVTTLALLALRAQAGLHFALKLAWSTNSSPARRLTQTETGRYEPLVDC